MAGFAGIISRFVSTVSIGAITGVAAISTAGAQETLTLKLGTTLPANHYISEHYLLKFAKEVEAATDGKVKFEFYPAGQLGKDIPTLLQSGVLDIGQVITGLNAQKFPLSSVAELPVAADNACHGTNKMWTLAQSGGLIDEVEYKPAGFRALGVSLLAPYIITTRNRKIEKVSDIEGMKIWVSGPAVEKAVAELKGVPIRISSTELYDAATRGTVDGAIFPYSGITQYGLEKVLQYATNNVNFGSGYYFIGISEDRWSKLPEEYQKIISEKVQDAQASFCAWIDSSDSELREKVRATSGVVMTDLDDAQKEAFVDVLGKVGDEWAATMDATGKKGTEVLKAFREASGN